MPYSLSTLNPNFLRGKKKQTKAGKLWLTILVALSIAILYIHAGYTFGEAWDYYKLPSAEGLN